MSILDLFKKKPTEESLTGTSVDESTTAATSTPVDSEEKAFFYEFLYRRLAYLYIDYKMWDKARDLLGQLKESSACHDFAMGELEYLDNIAK